MIFVYNLFSLILCCFSRLSIGHLIKRLAVKFDEMLEGVVASILTKYLGKYVDGLQRENLNVSLGEGDVVLENLTLRTDALEDLELPIVVRSGKILIRLYQC